MSVLRIQANGTPPYALDIRSGNTLIWGYSSMNTDDIVVPPNIMAEIEGKNVTYKLSDSNGMVFSRYVDSVTYNLKKKYYKGIAITNGSVSNHLEAIQKSIDRGLTYVGVIFNAGNWTDAQLNAFANATPYNHTVATTSYAFEFDEVIRKAYLSSPSSVANRVVLKVQILLTRDDNALSNGTTRTLFFGAGDLSKRPDGSPTITQSNSVVPQVTVGSIASINVKNYADKLLQAWMKRYRDAINDGTVLCVGLGNTRAAEGEYESTLTDASGNYAGFSSGDFNPSMIEAFKATYPAYASTDNNAIANNDLTNTDLGKRWYRFLGQYLAKFESDRIANVIANVPGITRAQWWLRDVGSYVDGQAGKRRTWSSSNLMNKYVMVVKCNDAPSDDGANRFLCDEVASLARLISGIAICEPTPPNHDFVTPYYRDLVRNMVAVMVARGVGASFISSTNDALNFYLTDTALSSAPATPKFRDTFKVVSGVRRAVSHTFSLAAIIAAGNTNPWKVSYEAFKADNGLTFADTLPVDLIN